MTLKVGVIGFPVEHSLSPAFQQVAFDFHGIAATYERWLTSDDEMPARVESLRKPDALGANVTIPHKLRAFELVDEVSERAHLAGAVNTIINRDGRLLGDNTDIPGFLTPLNELGFDFRSSSAVIIGAGGAARGVVVALLSAGISRIVVANRSVDRAASLRDDLGERVDIVTLDDDLTDEMPAASLLVNSTPVGWHDNSLPISVEQFDLLPSSAIVYDLTYRDTGILRTARRQGNRAIDGLPMLVHQGAESFRLWTGKEPPIDRMMRAAVEARDSQT